MTVEPAAAPVVRLTGLQVEFPLPDKSILRAVDGVDLVVRPGELVGIAGESGSGKTTLLRAVAGLTPVSGGSVEVNGQDVTAARGRARFKRRRGIQMVFQDPLGSLNPKRRVGDLVLEALSGTEARDRANRKVAAAEALSLVGLNPSLVDRYAGDLSGGQRQLVSIARALTAEPTILLCDEPVSALDVSVQARLLKTLRDLAEALGLAVLLVTHDLTVINYLCDRTYIMYAGTMVAEGPTRSILTAPRHPYTAALVASLPNLDPETPGMEPMLLDAPEEHGSRAAIATSGCPLAPRCWLRVDLDNPDMCVDKRPGLVELESGRSVACHFPEQTELMSPQLPAPEPTDP